MVVKNSITCFSEESFSFIQLYIVHYGFAPGASKMGSANQDPLQLDVGAAELMATPKSFMALCLPLPVSSDVQTSKGCSNVFECTTLFIYFCTPKKPCIGIQFIVPEKNAYYRSRLMHKKENMVKENCYIHEIIREQ